MISDRAWKNPIARAANKKYFTIAIYYNFFCHFKWFDHCKECNYEMGEKLCCGRKILYRKIQKRYGKNPLKNWAFLNGFHKTARIFCMIKKTGSFEFPITILFFFRFRIDWKLRGKNTPAFREKRLSWQHFRHTCFDKTNEYTNFQDETS